MSGGNCGVCYTLKNSLLKEADLTVRWEEWAGPYKSVLPSLRAAIGQYARNNDEIKIGLTVDPDRRWHAHKTDEWVEMVVLYKTSSPDFAKKVEKDLIEHGWKSHLDKSWNEITGGGSLQHGHSKYYVYVLLA